MVCQDGYGSLVLALAFCLTACGSVETAVTNVSMEAGNWDILHSYGMPAHPTAVSTGWVFSFPEGRDNCVSKKDANCPTVHYVSTKYTGTINIGAVIHVEGPRRGQDRGRSRRGVELPFRESEHLQHSSQYARHAPDQERRLG